MVIEFVRLVSWGRGRGWGWEIKINQRFPAKDWEGGGEVVRSFQRFPAKDWAEFPFTEAIELLRSTPWGGGRVGEVVRSFRDFLTRTG